MITDVIKWYWGQSASKTSNSSYQNKDKSRICRILLLQWKPIGLHNAQNLTGPHTATGWT